MEFYKAQKILSHLHYSCRHGPKKANKIYDLSGFIAQSRYAACKIWTSTQLPWARPLQEKSQSHPSTIFHNYYDESSTPNNISNHLTPMLWFQNAYPTPRQRLCLHCSRYICRLKGFCGLVMFRLGILCWSSFLNIVSLASPKSLLSSIKFSLCLNLGIRSFMHRTESLKRFPICAEVKRFGKWLCNTFYLFPKWNSFR